MADVDGIDGIQLMQLIERIERLEEERKGIGEDVTELFKEAKASGFEPKYMKRVIAWRKLDPEKREMDENQWDVYRRAAGL